MQTIGGGEELYLSVSHKDTAVDEDTWLGLRGSKEFRILDNSLSKEGTLYHSSSSPLNVGKKVGFMVHNP